MIEIRPEENHHLSLLVWANEANSTATPSANNLNNHLIAQKRLKESGVRGGWWRYEAFCLISTDTEDTGEAGPELSIQNTRTENSSTDYRTRTAGIQYRANREGGCAASWAAWARSPIDPNTAIWTPFIIQPLQVGIWYKLSFEANYRYNKYSRFRLRGGGLNITRDISHFKIAAENSFMKFGWEGGEEEEAFWISLESENKWNGCDGVAEVPAFHYKVYCDEAKLTRL